MALDTATVPELTAEQVQRILVQPLEARSEFLASGPRIFDTAGPLRIPKMGTGTDPQWYGENEQIVDQDVSFDEVDLLPSTMKSLKVLTRFSNELARQSVIALDAALKDRLVSDVAATLDAQFFSASGDGHSDPARDIRTDGDADPRGRWRAHPRPPARRRGVDPGRPTSTPPASGVS